MKNRVKKSAGDTALIWCVYALCALLCVSIVLPFVNIIAVSLSGTRPVANGQVTLYPKEITMQAYQKVVSERYFFTAYKNTLIVVVCGTGLSILLTVLTAFPLSRGDLPGKRALTFLMSLTMWFSGGMIPSFLLVRALGLYNTLWALFIPSAISAYNVIVVRNFFANVPASLEESAVIDGASDVVVLFRIFLPLSMPVLATVTLWVAVGYWNSFTAAVLYLADQSKYTLQVVLREIILRNVIRRYLGNVDMGEEMGVVEQSLKYANIILTILPVLCLYPFLQRYFVKGVLIGAVKG